MSKLFTLKQWLTMPDAARHLSGVFGEEVSEADVLRLGLDGHLTLSVNFVNGAAAHLGKVISEEDAKAKVFSRDITNPLMREAREFGDTTVGAIHEKRRTFPEEIRKAFEAGTLFWWVTDLKLDDEHFIHLEDEVSHIDMGDVWDLPLIGNERLDVEHRFQQLTDGPAIEGTNLNGTFAKKDDCTYASLQERFDSPDMRAEYEGMKKAFESALAKSGKPLAPAKPPKPYNHPDNYFPAGKLPDDSVLVVRTSALTQLQERMADPPKPSQPKESTREKNNLLRIIGLMANHRYSTNIGEPHTVARLLLQKATDLGVQISDDTIATHLKNALALVGNDGSPKK